jgi:uncharacterized protein YprB with RNaseH-like and TPR domain
MSLKTRLAHLQQQTGTQPVTPTPAQSKEATVSELRRRLASMSRTRSHARPPPKPQTHSIDTLADALQGEVIGEGLIQVKASLPLQGHHGRIALQQLQQAHHLPNEADPERRRVYLDTETTGLSGGSGTVAFLIGIALVTNEHIELTQLLITQFAAEAALLSALNALLTSEDHLVSYNGKSYDLPLLQTRYRMQGLKHPFATMPHLDLVHPMRRLFGQCWADCRLATVEANLLGFTRDDDLPGSQAPEAWFRYLRQGDARQLIRVVKHNREDIISLAVAHNTLAQAIKQPQGSDMDIAILARWLAETNREEAIMLLEVNKGDLCQESLRLLAELYRREERWQEAVCLWENLADNQCMESIERLAKYHEHVTKDLVKAWQYSQRLPEGDEHEWRRQRVSEKLARRDRCQSDVFSHQ